jgi:radical SAM protein with 4Fe4S-binding SPASM domain
MDCIEVSHSSSTEFIRNFNKRSAALRIPISGSIDLTRRCNLKCVHCYLGSHSIAAMQKEMDTVKILSVIDEICDAGCLYLLFTGGEPLLKADFPEIYCYAKNKGMIITVFTNGTLITDEILDLFENLPPHLVEISLYGATASTYEKISGVTGSYTRCINGINRLLSRKIHVSLKTILMTANSHEFFDIKNISQELGVKFRFDAEIFPRLDSNRSPLDLRVPVMDAIEKEFSDYERQRQWENYFQRTKGQSLPDTLYNCGAGITGFYIDPYGSLQPCLMVTNIKYSLLTGSFISGWKDVISDIINKKPGRASVCNVCEKRHVCSFCPAFFELENGSGDLPSEYICSMGNHRFQRIRNIVPEGDRHAA